MKFAILLAVFAVCGTLAKPWDPIRSGLNLGKHVIHLGEDAAKGGIGIAGNVINSIFGGHDHHSDGKGGDGKGGKQAEGGDNAKIQIIITLIQRIESAFSNGNFSEASTLVDQLLADLRKLNGSSSGIGGSFGFIIQLVEQLQAAAKTQNKALANSILGQLKSQVGNISGGGAAGGAGKLIKSIY